MHSCIATNVALSQLQPAIIGMLLKIKNATYNIALLLFFSLLTNVFNISLSLLGHYKNNICICSTKQFCNYPNVRNIT